ncbi:ATP-binding cassette domain-containing protein [Fundicoccus culcitae]|uniref:ATP-binding cassette domain-containing protein n=1 Tax=Fundicoccus culcitae TaxID=2969821 RepID=A0ABY5P7F9_9LACT|nr:ATP-binding cassette domain-containing protein [Fundicoccus culcitae]UUX34469.1 ATP-binding cassette domain-containing protein [Fundicoccus culcitae]
MNETISIEINNLSLNDEQYLNFSHTFRLGEPTVITGKSGSGKTTILKYLMGLKQNHKVQIAFNGNIKEESAPIFQDFKLVSYLSGYKNVCLPFELNKLEINKSELERLISQLQIDFSLKKKVNKLSGGQQQKLAILRALFQDKAIILGDEITSNLDQSYSDFISDFILERYSNRIIILVSHDPIVKEKCKHQIEL